MPGALRVGIDEAGRGPLLGPLVVAGVAVKDEDCLRDLGVRDSKKLTPARRERLSREIRAVCSASAVVSLSAADIDAGRTEQTLNDLELSAFVAVGRRLQASEYVLDAADMSCERFGRAFLRRLERRPAPRVLSVHRADAIHPVVAAASILAKVERDRHVAQITRRLQRVLNLPVGSGYPSDSVTVRYVRAYLEEQGELPPEVRTSWKPIRDLMAQRRLRPLTEF